MPYATLVKSESIRIINSGSLTLIPNCESVWITYIRGSLVVVVNFEGGFSVWTPVDGQIEFDESVEFKDIEQAAKQREEEREKAKKEKN